MEDDWAMCLSQQQLGYEYWFNTRSGKTFWCLPTNREKVAIIVPFRDLHAEQKRSQQLARFAPEMAAYLGSAEVAFKIYIIEQSDDGKKFNRGKLLNAGFDIARREGYSVFVLHDVDLIPSAELLPYYISPPAGSSPVHIARVWNRYSGNFKYFGGVVAFSTEQYEQINGYPNNYWGWGGEDDEMHNRVQEVNLLSFQLAIYFIGPIFLVIDENDHHSSHLGHHGRHGTNESRTKD